LCPILILYFCVADLRDRQRRPAAAGRGGAGAVRAAGRGETVRGAAADLRQQAGPGLRVVRLGHRRGSHAAHHQGQGLADPALLGHLRRRRQGRNGVGLHKHHAQEKLRDDNLF